MHALHCLENSWQCPACSKAPGKAQPARVCPARGHPPSSPRTSPPRLAAAPSPALCWCTLLVSVSFLLPFFFLVINFAFLACLSYFLPDWVFN